MEGHYSISYTESRTNFHTQQAPSEQLNLLREVHSDKR